uniref:5-hydroxytryptamine receptor 3A-like n=1 Tax=Pristiophorus japonicus TaxID=55135 RepID=UPI00398F297D
MFVEVFESRAIRPVKNFSQSLDINLTIGLHTILGLDEKQEILTTYICNGTASLSLKVVGLNPLQRLKQHYKSTSFATKGFVTSLEVDEDKLPEAPYLYVHHTGKVVYGKPLRIVSSCNINVLPLRRSEMLTYSRTHQLLRHRSETMEEITSKSQKIFASKGEWELIGIQADEESFLDGSQKLSSCDLGAICFLVSLAFMVTSLVETINVIHQNPRQQKAVPNWVQIIVLHYGAKLFCRRGKERAYHPVSRASRITLITDPARESKGSCPAEMEILQALLREIAEGRKEIKQRVERCDREWELEDEWLRIDHILDCFLHAAYLIFFVDFVLSLCFAWLM